MIKKSLPLISVLVCNYNYAKYINESLVSAVNQTYKNIEIVIIDDGSDDNSVGIIDEFVKDNPNIKISTKSKVKNEGLCYARNDAIEMAQGKYFVFLDSDDKMPTDYIARLYATMSKTNSDVVYSDVRRFGDEESKSDEPQYDADELLLHNYINISALVDRVKIGKHRFDVNLNRKSLEDYDFWLGLSLAGLMFTKSTNTYLNYRIQKKSRNKNTQPLKVQVSDFIDVWLTIIEKYRKIYPEKIDQNIYIEQLRYQVGVITNELSSLNRSVHEELIPELKVRHEHISQQNRNYNTIVIKNAELEKTIYELRNSKGYVLEKRLSGIANRVTGIFKQS